MHAHILLTEFQLGIITQQCISAIFLYSNHVSQNFVMEYLMQQVIK